jgi:hypothetical protein
VRILRGLLKAAGVVGMVIALVWAFGAIYFDGPFGKRNLVVAIIWALLASIDLWRAKSRKARARSFAIAFLMVFLPWLGKQPSNDRDWAVEYSRMPDVQIGGDTVTITDFRNFDYAPGNVTIPRWETRTFHLSKLKGVDLFLNYWGSEYIAHPIFSFDFGDDGQAAFSVETRREKTESFSTFGGLYKMYELIYLIGDERDFVRGRTNYRPDEDCYLYRLDITPEKTRERFLEYVDSLHKLRNRPKFYNVINANCTTAVRSQIAATDQGRLDWRLVLNGKLDEYLMKQNLLAVKGMPLPELKEKGHVDAAARTADQDPAFSKRIREGVPGF